MGQHTCSDRLIIGADRISATDPDKGDLLDDNPFNLLVTNLETNLEINLLKTIIKG